MAEREDRCSMVDQGGIQVSQDRPHWPSMLGIFLCSASAISFEIVLTRIFSIALWYHFAFMVISMAMLGLGLSGTLQSLFPGLKKERLLGTYSLGLGISIPLCCMLLRLIPFDPVRLAWEPLQTVWLCLYYLVISAPFLFFGLLMSASFALRSRQSSLIYGSDLLGAGLGSIGALMLLGITGPEKAVLLIPLLPLISAYLFGRRKAALMAAVVIALVSVMAPGIVSIRMSPYKPLHQALLYPGAEKLGTHSGRFERLDVFKSPLARHAPGLSLSYTTELPEQVGMTIDGSAMSALTEAREGPPEFVRHLPSALPYEVMKEVRSVLAIDPRGGLPVLMARAYGVNDIDAIESSPLLVDVINSQFMELSGRIYAENTQKALARGVLEGRGNIYDIIDMSLLNPVLSGKLGISEDYGLTREAFTVYLRRLNEEGILSASMYILPPYRAELRLLTTAISALEELGVNNSTQHIAAIRSWDVLSVMIKPVPFTGLEIERLRAFAKRNGFDPVYFKGIKAADMDVHIKTPSLELNMYIESIINSSTRDTFVSGYPFDISVPTDRRPFFHYYLRLGKLGDAYDLVGRKWQFFVEEGYLLPAMLLQAAILSAALLALPFLKKESREAGPKRPLIYFALLGLGFMFLEVPLIQRFILVFEHPPVAMAVVLASVLISSGVGSLISSRVASLGRPGTLLAIALIAAPYPLLLSHSGQELSGLPIAIRALTCFVLVFPLGALLGVPFPLGLSILGSKRPELIPWAWAVNGCFSVMAPLVAALLALSIGSNWIMTLGALMYALAYMTFTGWAFSPG